MPEKHNLTWCVGPEDSPLGTQAWSAYWTHGANMVLTEPPPFLAGQTRGLEKGFLLGSPTVQSKDSLSWSYLSMIRRSLQGSGSLCSCERPQLSKHGLCDQQWRWRSLGSQCGLSPRHLHSVWQRGQSHFFHVGLSVLESAEVKMGNREAWDLLWPAFLALFDLRSLFGQNKIGTWTAGPRGSFWS